jgi:hypothetical protein
MAYVAPIVARAEALAAKLETTYATDPVPTAGANAVRLAARAWSSFTVGYEWANLRDDVMNNAYVPLVSASPAGQKVRFNLQWELKGLGSAYSAGAFVDADPLIQACGWAGTFSSSPSNQWTYAPISPATLRPSCTIYVWSGANQYKVSGCRGNFDAMFRAGQIIRLTFALEGILQATPVAASVPAPTFTAVVPPAAISQVMSIGPWSADYDEVTLRSNNTLAWLYSGNSRYFTTDGGLQSYDIGLMRPEIVITARSTPQTTYDPIVDWSTATTRAFAIAWGTTQYNKGTATDAAVFIPSEPAMEVQKDFTGWRATYRCTAPSLLFN